MRIGSVSGIAGRGDSSLIRPVPDAETLPLGKSPGEGDSSIGWAPALALVPTTMEKKNKKKKKIPGLMGHTLKTPIISTPCKKSHKMKATSRHDHSC